MIYFAYGSNLDRAQMAQRCPSARLVGPAQLADHRVCFPRRSPIRGCAVASIEPHAGSTVWGAIYELDEADLARLDAREGYDPVNPNAANRYDRVEIEVEDWRGQKVTALTYVALPEDDPGLPSTDYLKLIVEGAVSHSFPDYYIAILKAFPVDTSA